MTDLISTKNATLTSSLLHDIDLLFVDIKRATEKSLAVTDNAEKFNNRGFWAQISGSVTGRNDTDLSKMIGSVSESLSITQRVVEMLLKIQSEKNVVLKDFHRAVTEKIVVLQSNDNTLDLSLRDNLIMMFEHLQKQVEDKLEQAATLEAHKTKLAKMNLALQQQEAAMTDNSNAITHLQAQLGRATAQMEDQTKTIVQLQNSLMHANEQMEKMQSHLDQTQANLATTESKLSDLRSNRLGKRDYLLFVISTLCVGTIVAINSFHGF